MSVVRPNRWDDREARLAGLLLSAIERLREVQPQVYEGPDTTANLNDRTLDLRARQELAQPRHADLDDRVRGPLVRWWRERSLKADSRARRVVR